MKKTQRARLTALVAKHERNLATSRLRVLAKREAARRREADKSA